MTSQPITIGDAIDVAISCFRAADYDNVLKVCNEILHVEPANVEALHLRGLANANCQNVGQAIVDLKLALLVRPDDFELLNNLGNFYRTVGQNDLARECYEKVLLNEPNCHPAVFNLGNVLAELGQMDAAQDAYRKAIGLDPNFAEAFYNLGLLLRKGGDIEQALATFKQCIARNTDHVQAQVAIGNCLLDMGKTDDAMNAYKVATVVDPNAFETFNNMGVVLTEQGKYAEAKTVLESALRLREDFDAARNNLGVVQFLTGDFEAAADSFSEVLTGNPENPQAYRNLGKCLAESGAFDEAILTYRTSLRFDPSASDVAVELAAVYCRAGYTKQSLDAFEQLKLERPDSFVPVLGHAVASLPRFFADQEALAAALSVFEELLVTAEACLDLSSAGAIDDAVFALALLQPTHLVHQTCNVRSVLQRFGALAVKIMSAKYPHWAQPLTIPSFEMGQIKIGVVSDAPGIFENLSSEKFQVIQYSTRSLSFEDLCSKIRADNLHALVYLSLKSNPTAFQLAALRLSAVQCVTWEQGLTTGLPTIDYFLSGDLLEPVGADGHYSETLVRLPNLFSYYRQVPATSPAENEEQSTQGLREGSVRFLCGQPVVNYLPEQDQVLVDIAKLVPNAQFVFLGGKDQSLADALKKRVSVCFEEAGLDAEQFIVVLPSVNMEHVQIFLDSLHLNDFGPAIEALGARLPVLTTAGEFMRGRQSAGLLRQIDVVDTIAADNTELVSKAAELAEDIGLRLKLSSRIDDRKHWAYRDQEAVTGLEEFLRRVTLGASATVS